MADKVEAVKTTKTAVKSDVKTITLTFEGKDLELHKKIVAQAESEDRSASIELLRFVRTNFAKPISVNQAGS